MAERQATIDGTRYDLDGLFFVIATQNPVEFRGTYPLPEAQMDRFMIRSRLGYVSADEECAILSDQAERHPVETLEPCIDREDTLALMQSVKRVGLTDELRRYIVDLVAATRQRRELQLAASPRASLALMRVAQAVSLFEGRDFVVPETIQEVAADVIAHRLVLEPESRLSGLDARGVVDDIVDTLPVP
jgi:MoxR-like ATPase